MDNRYRHPQVAHLWDTPWTYDAWWRIEQAVIRAQLDLGLIKSTEASIMVAVNAPTPEPGRAVEAITKREAVTKHDVAAFLAYVREWWGEPHAKWIHYGLTSSDLVDTAQGLRFKAMLSTLIPVGAELLTAAEGWLTSDMIVLGRTHGMAAEPTAMKVRAAHWVALLLPAIRQLQSDSERMRLAKTSGPVGTYAHTPPEVEYAVAKELGLAPVAFGASQIAPRGNLGRWANSAAEMVQACAKVAMDWRLLFAFNEARPFQSEGQVGSSAMAHKNNPVRAEQITGLARLAAGYASMLQPLDLWLERDISHSSVERIAVPDLWHVLLHAMNQTASLLSESLLNPSVIQDNLENNANAAYTHHTTLFGIQEGMTYEQAREFGLSVDIESYTFVQDCERDFMVNYPRVR